MAKRKISTANFERRTAEPAATPSPPVPGGETVGKAEDVLHRLAEDLGRLVARRLGERRKGYGLLGMLAGTLIIAFATLLLYRATHR